VLIIELSSEKHALQNIQNDCYEGLSGSCRVHQIRFRPGLRSGPSWVAHDAPPDLLVGWGGGHPLPIPHPPRRLRRLVPETPSEFFFWIRPCTEPTEKQKTQFTFSGITKHAARKVQRSKSRKQDTDTPYRIAKLFTDNANSYRIEKVHEYRYDKCKSIRSEWKSYGEVDIFQVHNVVTELINRTTEGHPENVRLQISLENTHNNRIIETKLMSKYEVIEKAVEWVNIFIVYYDMKMEDITLKLLTIQIPTGSRRVNKIITLDGKRSIIQIRNKDTICLARALVVGLAVNNRETLQYIFRNKLTEDELKQINETRQTISQIHKGILSDNEKKYLVDGKNLQDVLAKALHRLCTISINETGNDFDDVKHIEERLNIEIQIYNFESRQIYKSKENPIKVYILMSENHFDVISNIAGFTCANEDHHKSEKR